MVISKGFNVCYYDWASAKVVPLQRIGSADEVLFRPTFPIFDRLLWREFWSDGPGICDIW